MPFSAGEIAMALLTLASTGVAVGLQLRLRNETGHADLLLEEKNLLLAQLNKSQEEAKNLRKQVKTREADIDQLRRYEALCNMSESGACLCNSEGGIEWVNRAWEQTTGFSLEECRGRKPGRILQGPETDPATVKRLRHAIETRHPITEELTNYTKNGARLWVKIHITPIQDSQGNIIGFGGVQTDLTLRRVTQKRLERTHEKAELALSTGQFGLWEWLPPQNRCDWDERCCRLYASDMGAPNYEAWINLVHKADRAALETHLRSVLIGKEPLKASFRTLPDLQGKSRSLEICGIVQRDENGSPLRMTGIVRDISSEREMREQLMLAMERLRLSLKGAGDGVWEWRLEEDRFSVDERWPGMPLTPVDETKGSRTDIETLLHPEDVLTFKSALESVVVGKSAHIDIECRVSAPGGAWIWIGWRGGLLVSPNEPRIRTICGTYSDTSLQHQTSEALHRSTLLLRQMCQQMGIAAWEIEAESFRLHWTEELDLLHVAPHDFVPTLENVLALYPEDSRRELSGLLELALDAGEGFDVEIRWNAGGVAKNSWFRWIGQPVRREGKIIGACGLIQNVTHAHEAAAQRRELDAKLSELRQHELLGSITDDLAFDLNSMLNSVLGYQELASEELPAGNKACEYLRESMRNTHRTHEILRQVLLLSRVRPPAYAELRLPTLLDDFADRLVEQSPGLSVEKEIDRRCPNIFGDTAQLQHALGNLSEHLLAALPAGPRVVRIQLRCYEPGDSLDSITPGPGACLEMRFPDCGLNPEEWRGLLESTQGDPGLNLTVARKILLDHGMSIQAELEAPAQGCCRMIIPFSGERKVELLATAPSSASSLVTIWIVDEERFISHLAGLSLEKMGYRIRILRSPDDCIRLLNTKEEHCDALLLGSRFSESTPAQLAAQSRVIRPGLAVVAMCGSEGAGSHAGCVILQEPFTAADLSRAIAEALGQTPARNRPLGSA